MHDLTNPFSRSKRNAPGRIGTGAYPAAVASLIS
jgi:hypothetical protein